MQFKPIKFSGILAATVLLALFPVIFSNPAITTVAVFTLLFAAAATGWNMFSGYTGYISIGHAAYYGLGAYVFALFCQLWKVQGGWMPFLLVPLVGLATVVCAAPVGWIALKTRTYRFLIITVAIFVFSTQIPNFLGNTPLGGAELSLPLPLWRGAAFNEPFYYVAFSLLALALAVSWWIRRSKYGLALLAIRDDEDRALGMGLRTDLYKLSAFLLSAFFVSMVGAVSAYFLGFIAPSSAFDTSLNLLLPLLAMFGGVGTQLGPALGALVLIPLQQNLTLQFGAQNWDLILFGAAFLLVVLLMPEGVLPTLRKKAPLWLETASALFPQFARFTHFSRSALLPEYGSLAISSPVSSPQATITSPFVAIAIATPLPIAIPDQEPEPMVVSTPVPEVLATPEPSGEEDEQVAVEALEGVESVEEDEGEATAKRLVPPKAQAVDAPASPSMALAPMTTRSLMPTQRMKAIRLVGMDSQATHELSPVQVIVRAPTPPASLASRSAQVAGGVCPRCGSPLRVLEVMVYCRKCGLIVSKNA